MRGIFLGGLGLALGCLVTYAHGDDTQWRPVASTSKPSPIAVGKESSSIDKGNRSRISLQKPIPLNNGGNHDVPSFRPVSFNHTSNSFPRPIIRANHDQEQVNPLPVGPQLEGGKIPPPMPKKEKVELAPPPKQFPGNPNPSNSSPPFPGGDFPPGSYPVPMGVGPGETIEPDWGGQGMVGDECVEAFACPQDCCRVPLFYFGAEYLLWTIRNPNLPPLVTQTTMSPAELVALGMANPNFRPGALNNTGTQVLYGGDTADLPVFSGGRFTLGFGPRRLPFGIETTFFFLGQQNDSFATNSFGQPALYRPFYNVTNPGNDAELVSFPFLVGGSVNTEFQSRMWGAELNFRRPVYCGVFHKVDFLLGFRFLELNESLTVRESVNFMVNTGDIQQGDNIQVQDSFGTRNRFYGGQIGFDWRWMRFGRVSLDLLTKIGIGNMQQGVNINGQTTFTTISGSQTTAPGGLLAQPTNIGSYVRNQFAVIPEIGVKLGYQLTDHMNVFVGYNFLYISSVVRPGDQVDLNINTTQIPSINSRVGGNNQLQGPAQPMFMYKDTSFWAQGFNVGLEWRY